jgi:2-oxoglutarate/2-oxoacid ferredoxin oxidoreductase subunit alpha
MVKDEDVCVHCGLCAERCPTAAWDMRKFDCCIAYAGAAAAPARPLPRPRAGEMRRTHDRRPDRTTPIAARRRRAPRDRPLRVNDFAFKIATVNGTGSASANGLLMQAIFRMGIPVTGKNVFPSNIQGLPTWYEIRVSRTAHGADAALRPGGRAEPRHVRPRRRGGALPAAGCSTTRPGLDAGAAAPARRHLPRRAAGRHVQRAFQGRRERILMKNIAYVGALAALLDMDRSTSSTRCEGAVRREAALLDSNHRASALGYDYAREHFDCPLPIRLEPMDATARHILIDGNTAAALGCVYAGATVGAWYPITPSTSLMDAFRRFCERTAATRRRPSEPLRDPAGRGRAGGIGMVIGAAGPARAPSRRQRARASR